MASDDKTAPANKDSTPAEEHPAVGVFAYVAGGVIGLVILVGLAALLQSEGKPSRSVQELPHLAILLAFDDLHDAATRESIASLQRDLVETGLAVVGPLNYPILVPGEQPGDEPTAKNLDALSVEELTAAETYFQTGRWLSPRVYSPDLREVIIRVAPPALSNFPSGSTTKVKQVLEAYKGRFREVLAYSRALGLEDDTARARINLVFGVQTANVLAISPTEGQLLEGDSINIIFNGAEAARHPKLRLLTTMGHFVQYAWGVRTHSVNPTLSTAPTAGILDFAKTINVPSLITADGKQAWIQCYTDAEGEENAELCYFLAGNLEKPEGANIKAMRIKKVEID